MSRDQYIDQQRTGTALALRALIAGGLCCLLLAACDWTGVADSWQAANARWWIGSLASFAGCTILGWIALSVMLRIQVGKAQWRRLLRRHAVVGSLAALTPARSAELLMIAVLAREGISPARTLKCLLILRILSLVLLLAFAIPFAGLELHNGQLTVSLIALGALAGVAIYGVGRFAPTLRSWLLSWQRRNEPSDAPPATNVERRLLKIDLAMSFAILVAQRLLHAFAGYCVVRSLGLPIEYLPWLGLVSLVGIVGMLPITLWGLGVREGMLSLGFQIWGLSIESALAVSLICRAIDALNMAAWSLAFYVVDRERSGQQDRSALVDPRVVKPSDARC